MRDGKRLRPFAAAALLGMFVAGCGGGGSEAAEAAGEDAVIVTPENVVIASSTRIESGPTISGTLEPRHEANVRAEVAGSVLETYAERGEAVVRGAALARLDDAALRDSFLSARSAANTAEQSAVVARASDSNDPKDHRNAQDQDASGRGQALPEDRFRQVQGRPRQPQPHPHQESDEAEAQPPPDQPHPRM